MIYSEIFSEKCQLWPLIIVMSYMRTLFLLCKEIEFYSVKHWLSAHHCTSPFLWHGTLSHHWIIRNVCWMYDTHNLCKNIRFGNSLSYLETITAVSFLWKWSSVCQYPFWLAHHCMIPTVNYNYIAFRDSLWLSNTSILLPQALDYWDKSTQMDVLAARGFRAISFIYCLSIVCGSVARAFPELSLGRPTQHSDEKHGPKSPREVVIIFLPTNMKECFR